MTLRKALYTSRNVPAVKALKAVSTDKAQQFAANLGIDVDYLVESDAIGGGRVNISPTKMAVLTLLLVITGFIQIHTSLKKSNSVTAQQKTYKPESKVAMEDYTAYMVTDVLRDVVSNKEALQVLLLMSLVLILQVKQVQQTTVAMILVNIIYLLQQYRIHGLLVIHQTTQLLSGVVIQTIKIQLQLGRSVAFHRNCLNRL